MGSREGFPCEVALTDRLNVGENYCNKKQYLNDAYDLLMNPLHVHPEEKINISDSLDESLMWCENQVVVKAVPELNPIDPLHTRSYIREKKPYLRQVLILFYLTNSKIIKPLCAVC